MCRLFLKDPRMSSKTKVRNHHFVWLHNLAEKGKEPQEGAPTESKGMDRRK